MKKEELASLLGRDDDMSILAPIEDQLRALATEEELSDVAVAACLIRIEEASPALCAILARAADGEALSEDEATLLFRGLHILGGARQRRAWQPLLRLLRRSADDLDKLLGDTVTETLARIVAGVFEGDADTLFDAIADRSIDEFVREALLGAATFLAWEGRVDRDRMRLFLERFYTDRLAADGEIAWVGWLQAIAMLGLRPLAPLVESAWREGCIPDEVLEPRHFEQDLAEAEREPGDADRFKRARLGYIEDVIEALAWNDYAEPSAVEEDPEPFWALAPAPIAPVINPMRHVGRNDPCPCGSGKKAKKCCLGN